MRLRACTAKEANVAPPVMVHLLQQLCLTIHDAMQIYTHKTIIVTSSAKTGEKTFEHLKEEIELLETAHNVPVIAVISDAAGEAAKARRLLRHSPLLSSQQSGCLLCCVTLSQAVLDVYSLHHGAVHETSSNMSKFYSMSFDTFHGIDCYGHSCAN